MKNRLLIYIIPVVRQLFLVLSVLVFLMLNCFPFASKQILPETEPELLVRKIESYAAKLNTLQGYARLSVNSELINFNGTMQVCARLPDSLYAKVEGPFGVDVALMRLYENELLFYSPVLQMAYTESLDDSMFNLLPFQINTAEFMLQTLGILIIPKNRLDEIVMFYSQDNQYIIVFENGERVWIQPKGPVITRWEKTNGKGDIIWTWEGQYFKKVSGIRMPRVVKITTEEPRQKLTVYYTQRKANQHLKSGWSQVKLPEGVKPVAL